MMKALDDFSAAFNAAERRRQSNVIRDRTRPEGSWPEPGLRHSEPVRTPAWESVSAAVPAPAVPRRDNHDVYHAVKQPAAPEFTHSAGSFGGTATKTPAQDKSADGGAGDLTHRSGKLDDLTGRLAGMPSYQEATEDDYPRTFWGEIRHALSPQEIGRSGRQLGDIQTAMATDDVMDPLESAAFGAFRPALSTGEALARSFDRDFGDEASHRRMDELGDRLDATLKKAEEAHPLAYAFGGAVGTIPLVNGVAAAVGAIPGVEALGANLRAALTGGAVRGADRLLDGLGDVTAGRTDPRDYVRGVARGAWNGALAAGTLEELSELGQKLLLPRSAGSGAAGLLPGTAGGRGKLRDILGLLGTGQNDLTKNAADAAAAAAGYLDRAAAVGDEAAYRTALSVLRDSARELRTLAPALPSAGAAAAAELADRAIRALPEHAASLPDGLTVRNGLVERMEEAYNHITEAPGDDVSADEVDIENQPKAATREKADDGPWFYTKKYAYPRLNSREWDLLNHTMDSEIETTEQYLDEGTKWLFANKKGTQVFALYGIGDGTDPTPLYAVGGKRAVRDYEKLMKRMEGKAYGNQQDRAAFDRLLGDIESK